MEVYVGYLRRKIDTPFGLRSIETLRGVGYRMVEPADAAESAPGGAGGFRGLRRHLGVRVVPGRRGKGRAAQHGAARPPGSPRGTRRRPIRRDRRRLGVAGPVGVAAAPSAAAVGCVRVRPGRVRPRSRSARSRSARSRSARSRSAPLGLPARSGWRRRVAFGAVAFVRPRRRGRVAGAAGRGRASARRLLRRPTRRRRCRRLPGSGRSRRRGSIGHGRRGRGSVRHGRSAPLRSRGAVGGAGGVGGGAYRGGGDRRWGPRPAVSRRAAARRRAGAAAAGSAARRRSLGRQLGRGQPHAEQRTAAGVSSTHTLPSCAATTSATMARPSPEPPSARARASSSRTNRSKIRLRSSAGTPGPSSATSRRRPGRRRARA